MSRNDSAGPSGTPPASSPTYKDLPPDPPFGPVLPYRQPTAPQVEPPPAVPGEASGITPGQIALAVGGLLLLLAVGIGAALWLLRDDPSGTDPLPQESVPDSEPFGQLTPAPNNPPEDETANGRDPDPLPSPSQGELAPPDQGTDTPPDEAPPEELPSVAPEDGGQQGDAAPPDAAPPDAVPPEGGTLPEASPQPDSGQAQPPGGQDTPAPDPNEGEVELPLLFELTQLPGGTSETDTTVTQTTTDEEDPELEQVTHIEHPDGEITVRALRSADAAARFEALLTDDAQEVSVQGQTAYLLEGQRLVWLVETDPNTFLSISGPATVGTDELLTIANGLELS